MAELDVAHVLRSALEAIDTGRELVAVILDGWTPPAEPEPYGATAPVHPHGNPFNCPCGHEAGPPEPQEDGPYAALTINGKKYLIVFEEIPS